MSMPPASTAHVPVARDPSCAAVSIPRARPDATTSSLRRDRAPACRRACARVPRHCARRRWRPSRAPATSALPSTLRTGGGGSRRCKPARKFRFRRSTACARRALRSRRVRAARRRRSAIRMRIAAAAPRQPRHFFQRRRSRSEARNQSGKGHRSHVLRACQTQPGAPSLVGKREAHSTAGGLSAADARFFASHQARDVLTVHPIDEDREGEREKHRQRICPNAAM